MVDVPSQGWTGAQTERVERARQSDSGILPEATVESMQGGGYMTGRELLDRNARRLGGAKSRVIAAIIASLLGSILFRPMLVAAALLVLFVQGFLGEGVFVAMRCPWCGGDIGSYGDWPPIRAKASLCLHCGRSMDDELAAPGKPKKASSPWDELA
jgi:hypothetical protein